MTDTTYKAERREIFLGHIPLEAFRLPSGEYCLSQTSVSDAINKPEVSIRRFLRSKYLKALSSNVSQSDAFLEENQARPLSVEGSNKPINTISFELCATFWHWWASKNHPKAQALLLALVRHSLQFLFRLSPSEICPISSCGVGNPKIRWNMTD